MMVYMLFRVTIYFFSIKQIISDRRGNPDFAMVTGHHGGWPLHLGFEGEVVTVGADPRVCPEDC